MKEFLNDDFLLTNDTAKIIYNECAKTLPIIDYHCHINPADIANDITFNNLTELWLSGDHYKWRLMRASGINEDFITGSAPPFEKFLMWARALETAIGNPLYHWSHLELRRFFGYTGTLTEATAKDVWRHCNDILSDGHVTAKTLITISHVTHICTTDDPTSTLTYHKQIADDIDFKTAVLPAFRPDFAMNIENPNYFDYLKTLGESSSTNIQSFLDLKVAVANRLSYFVKNGCRLTDHALTYVNPIEATDEELERVFAKRKTTMLSHIEECEYKTAFLLFIAKECVKHNLTMQIHYGCKRNNNTKMYNKLGADTGYDCIYNYTPSDGLANFLNLLNNNEALPRMIIYSLNPVDNAAIDSVIGCYQDGSVRGKLQHGSAWWFNDNISGMRDQLISLANIGNLSTFVGMLTDSRSFLSYPRHEYFRRILCNLLGSWVENGEYPFDKKLLFKIVSDISYNNALKMIVD